MEVFVHVDDYKNIKDLIEELSWVKVPGHTYLKYLTKLESWWRSVCMKYITTF